MSSDRFIRTIPKSIEAVRALKRHGTTTLYAGFNILDGIVIGHNMQQHRHQEFIRFLNTIEEQVLVGRAARHLRMHPLVVALWHNRKDAVEAKSGEETKVLAIARTLADVSLSSF